MKKVLFDLTATQPVNNIFNHGGGEYAKAVFLNLTISGRTNSRLVGLRITLFNE